MLKALNFVHRKPIVHRDLKLSNVLISSKKDLSIKVCDFGYAAFFNKDESLEKRCGTAPYCAPELWDADADFNEKIDIWALGIMTYLMLFGVENFPFNIDVDDMGIDEI